MKKGFTLVELSIVLIIIGLLVGGILVGQSLVNAAAMRKTVSMINQFDVAALNYKTQFKYLPGDNPNEPAFNHLSGYGACQTDPDGLGDGIIDAGCWSGRNVAGWFYGGVRSFWYIISSRKLSLDPRHEFHSNVSPRQTAYHAPIAKSGDRFGFWVGCRGAGNVCSTDSTKANYYAILEINIHSSGTHGLNGTTPTGAAVKPADALALDQKLDDGLADAGDVRSGSANSSVSTTPLANCSAGPAYTITDPDYECIPIIRLGAQVGQVQ